MFRVIFDMKFRIEILNLCMFLVIKYIGENYGYVILDFFI